MVAQRGASDRVRKQRRNPTVVPPTGVMYRRVCTQRSRLRRDRPLLQPAARPKRGKRDTGRSIPPASPVTRTKRQRRLFVTIRDPQRRIHARLAPIAVCHPLTRLLEVQICFACVRSCLRSGSSAIGVKLLGSEWPPRAMLLCNGEGSWRRGGIRVWSWLDAGLQRRRLRLARAGPSRGRRSRKSCWSSSRA